MDTRIFYNYRKKENDSTHILFTPAAASGLQCSGGPCEPHLFGYTKHNPGFEAYYRLNAENRVGGGYEYEHAKREDRLDFPNTQEHKFFGEWRNSTLDWVDTRLRYQYMQRRGGWSNHPTADAIDAFVRRYDLAPVDQHQLKLRFDTIPAPLVDLSFDVILKYNDYKETILGRTKDWRQEYYVTAGYGSVDSFRVYAFGDSRDREARFSPPRWAVRLRLRPTRRWASRTPTNFNWTVDNDWTRAGSSAWARHGSKCSGLPGTRTCSMSKRTARRTSAFPVRLQGSSAPADCCPRISTARSAISFNLKGVYQHDRNWTFTGGYAWERYKYSEHRLR